MEGTSPLDRSSINTTGRSAQPGATGGRLQVTDGKSVAVTRGGEPLQQEGLVRDILSGTQRMSAAAPAVGSTSDAIRAEVAGYAADYGNKAANLMVLARICAGVRSSVFQTQVPPILPLSHSQILSHIQQHYPNFDKDWEQFVSAQRGSTTLTPEGRLLLEGLRENMRTLFREHPVPVDLTALGDGPLMVRSTGREDTQEGAMAGANESIAGVRNSAAEVSAAIGSVVASYLSEASMMQKIIAGMSVEERPFVPVLLQAMIGESPGAAVPPEGLMVAGVAYTKEMAGETKDLTVVEAAFGHNEGVVNAEVNTDTYYIYPGGPNHQVVAHKPDRLVANAASAGSSRFERVENPAALARSPALSRDLQQQMRLLSKAIHDAYGQPMDIEWVYDPSKKTVYVVQARPVVQRYRAEPGIVDSQRLSGVSKGRMIVHRGGEPVVITHANQLVQRRNLESALKVFLNPELRRQIRAVVVEEMGSALSHAACVFRENGIPVLCAPAIDPDVFRATGTVAVLDGQQGLIGTMQRDAFVGQEPAAVKALLLEDDTLKPGWFRHPIAPDESLQDYGLTDVDLARLGRLLLTDVPLGDIQLTEMFAKLSGENPQEADAAARAVVSRIALTVKNLGSSADPVVAGLAENGKRLLGNALVILDSMLGAQDRMQRLHAARRLEALCYQESSTRILETESVRNLLVARGAVMGFDVAAPALDDADQGTLIFLQSAALGKISDNAMRVQLQAPMTDQERDTCALVFRSVKPLIMGAEAQERWEQLTAKLVGSRSRIANQLLVDLITQVEKAGILSDWLNLTVAESPADMGTSLGLIIQWRNQWRAIRPAMSEILKLQRNLVQLESAGAAWKNPKAFDALWQKMLKQVIAPLQQKIPDLVSGSEKNPLLHAALHRVILDGIEAFDHCIKYARSDAAEAADTKVARFATMLTPYRDLMLQLFDAIPEESFAQWTAALMAASRESTTPQAYRQSMRQTINDTFEGLKDARNAAQTEPSARANVMAQCVNSGALFEMTFSPKEATLEDLFTLCHQNMLAALDCFRPSYDSGRLPASLNAVLTSIGGINKEIIYSYTLLRLHPTMNSQTLHYPIVRTVFNLPIKYHSGKITVEHNLARDTTSVQFDIYGHNMNDRMDLLSLLIASRSWNEGVRLMTVPAYDNGTRQLSCTWECEGHAAPLCQILLDAAEATLAGNFGVVPYIQADRLFQTNPEALTVIAEAPGQLRQLCLSSLRGKFYAWEIVNEVVAYGQNVPISTVCALLGELGIKIQAASHQELIAILVVRAKQELRDNKSDQQITEGYSTVPVDPIKRLAVAQIEKDSNFIRALWDSVTAEDFSMFLCPGPGDLGGSGLYPGLCSAYADYLIATDQMRLLLSFVTYLAAEGQYASLIAIQNDVERPIPQVVNVPTGFLEPKIERPTSRYDSDDDSGTDYGEMAVVSDDEGESEAEIEVEEQPREQTLCERIDDVLGGYPIPGRRATAAEMHDRSDPIYDASYLQPGQWLLLPVQARGGRYLSNVYRLALIESVSPEPVRIVVRVGGGKSQTLDSIQYVKLLGD